MEIRNVPYFLLKWLRENTNHYQYISENAQLLKQEIEQMNIVQNEQNQEACVRYWEFMSMVENNPMTGEDRAGNPAQILANDFYYFFYPQSEEAESIYYPLILYLKLGSIETEKKADALYQRLLASLKQWKKQFNESTKKKERNTLEFVSENAQIERIYGRLLRKKTAFFLIQEIFLILLSGFGCWRVMDALFIQKMLELTDVTKVSGVAFYMSSVICLIYFFKGIKFLWREKRRRQLLNAWKNRELVDQDREQNQVKAEFRSEEGLKKIFEQMFITRNYQPYNMPFNTSQNSSTEKAIELTGLLEPKNEKLINTVRPLHLLVICLACICLCLIYPKGFPEEFLNYKFLIHEFLAEKVSLLMPTYISDNELYAIQLMQGIEVEITSDICDCYYSLQLSHTEKTSGIKGMVLEFRGIETTDDSFWYKCILEDKICYISAKDAELIDKNACLLESVKIKQTDGKPEEINKLNDGQILTGQCVKAGDKIEIELENAASLLGMYLLNGYSKNNFSSGIRKAKITIGNGKEYIFLLNRSMEKSGYFIGLPNEVSDTITIEILDVENESAGLSEFFIYSIVQ